jgi:hypothetical protein
LNANGTLWLAKEYVQFSASYFCYSNQSLACIGAVVIWHLNYQTTYSVGEHHSELLVVELTERSELGQGYPLNLSILISGGKETNKDSPSNGE